MITPALTTTATLLSYTETGTDLYGKPVVSYVSAQVPGCVVGAVGTSTEITGGQDTSTVQYAILFPPGTAVKTTDRVTTLGMTFEVDGDPVSITSVFTGWNPGVRAVLKLVEG